MMFWIRFRKFLLYFFLSILIIFIVLIVLAFVFQNKLKTIAITEINKQLNGEILLKGDISFSFIKHFPNASVSFHQVVLRDKIKSHQAFIEADEFDAGFNTIKIFKGEYVLDAIYLKNTTLYIVDYKNGLSNYKVFKNQTSNSKSSSSIKVEKLVIEKCKLMFENQKSNLILSFNIDELSANGIYENEKLHTDFKITSIINADSKSLPQFSYNKPLSISGKTIIDVKNQAYDFENIVLNLADNELELNGSLIANKILKLNFKGKDFDVKNLTELLPNNVNEKLKGTEGKGLLNNFSGKIENNFSTNNFSIDGNFNCGNGTLHIANWKNNFTNINMVGMFSIDKLNSIFILKKFDAELNDAPFSLFLTAKNYGEGQLLETKISGNISVEDLMALNNNSNNLNASGNIICKDFNATIALNNKTEIQNIVLKNEIEIKDLNIKNNNYTIEKLNASLLANRDGIAFENANFKVNNNSISVSGFLSSKYFYTTEKELIDLNITAEKLDINSLLVANSTTTKDSIPSNNWLDFPLHTKIKCNEANYNKFKMQNIDADVSIVNNEILINQFTTETQNGNLNLSGKLIQSENEIAFLFNSNYKNLNITSTFEQFENFNQTMLKAENVNGNLTGTTTVSGKFDKEFIVIPKSISSSSDIAVSNGELKNVSQLLSLSKYLNVDDLKHLKFATLKNQIEIGDGKIIIPEMRIQNNALNINVSGTHTFDNEMDYLFKINLMDWFGKKLGKTTDDNWEEDNDKKGFNVFLRMTGKGNNLKIVRDKKSSRDKFKENLKAEHETLKALIKADLKGETKREKPIDFKQDEKIELINWDDTTK